MKPWTLTELDKLKRLWKGGFSQRQISKMLPRRTIAAVAGKIDRLGLRDNTKRKQPGGFHKI